MCPVQVSKEFAEKHRQFLKAERDKRGAQGTVRPTWHAPGEAVEGAVDAASIGSWQSGASEHHAFEDARPSAVGAPSMPRGSSAPMPSRDAAGKVQPELERLDTAFRR